MTSSKINDRSCDAGQFAYQTGEKQGRIFCLMSSVAAPTFKMIKILDCKLFVRKVKLSLSVFVATCAKRFLWNKAEKTPNILSLPSRSLQNVG